MLEAAREKNCSLSVVAKLRSDEVQGGAHASSVEYWNRKVLGIYFEGQNWVPEYSTHQHGD